MKTIIEIAKWFVRHVLLLTPVGRSIYAKRKANQQTELLQRVQNVGPEIIAVVSDLFRKEDIGYYISGGTLLGCIRDGGIMKHDDDVDFSLLPGEKDIKLIIAKLESVGFEYFWAWGYEGQVTEFAMTYKGVHVDFYLLHEAHGNYVTHWYTPLDGMEYPSKNVWSAIELSEPIVIHTIPYTIPQYGIKTMVPENYETDLEMMYGAWRNPDPNWRASALAEIAGSRRLLPGLGRKMSRGEI